MKILCRLKFDVHKDLGLIDRVDPETGEVIQTAEDYVREACSGYTDIRPCAKRGKDGRPARWVEKRRGCLLQNGKRRCEHCLKVIYEEGDPEWKGM